MGSDIAENDYLSRTHVTSIQETLQNQSQMFTEEEVRGDRDDCYTHVQVGGGAVEVTHSNTESIIHIVNERLTDSEFRQFETEAKRAVSNARVGSYEFDTRNSDMVTYRITHPESN